MTDLIDRDALIKQWESDIELMEDILFIMATGAALNDLKHQPTVDAVPVRHGKWDKGTDSYWHICEECGAEVDISMGTGVWVEGVELYELKYCPNCGARMDAEREHGQNNS